MGNVFPGLELNTSQPHKDLPTTLTANVAAMGTSYETNLTGLNRVWYSGSGSGYSTHVVLFVQIRIELWTIHDV